MNTDRLINFRQVHSEVASYRDNIESFYFKAPTELVLKLQDMVMGACERTKPVLIEEYKQMLKNVKLTRFTIYYKNESRNSIMAFNLKYLLEQLPCTIDNPVEDMVFLTGIEVVHHPREGWSYIRLDQYSPSYNDEIYDLYGRCRISSYENMHNIADPEGYTVNYWVEYLLQAYPDIQYWSRGCWDTESCCDVYISDNKDNRVTFDLLYDYFHAGDTMHRALEKFTYELENKWDVTLPELPK